MNKSSLLPEVESAGDGETLLAEADAQITALLEGDSMPSVEYTFSVLNGPPIIWAVRRIEFVEELSEPYRVRLTLVSQELDVSLDQLLGADCELSIDRQPSVRMVRGLIRAVESLGTQFNSVIIRVELVPALELLRDRVDTRVWQWARVPDVVEEVLTTGLRDYGRRVELRGILNEYPEREYIVQYHESDFAFVSRLLEEEGIRYRFAHEEDRLELLLLEDSLAEFDPVMTVDEKPLIYLVPDLAEDASVETMQAFNDVQRLTSTSVHQRVFDWCEPFMSNERIEPADDSQADGLCRVREVYHHGRFVEADPGPRTARKLAHRRDQGRISSGLSNVTGFCPGRCFVLVDPSRPELFGAYVITRVVHEGACPEVVLNANDEGLRYTNRFECRALDPGRPLYPLPRTPRPKVRGPQTAIVTGPPGEEIHTDEHGRVKVRFGWDRLQGLSEDTSMWIRVAQRWAGPGYGSFFVPRVGMEVVVEFIEGDPDKPLITGCVYNGANDTSVSVPVNKTRSTIRTASSPGGGGFNELRFEDLAGGEEIYLHAQRDLNEMVLHCQSTTVLVNQATTVGVNQTETIGVNQTEIVGANQTMTVGANRTKTVGGDETNTIQGSRSTIVECDESLTVLGITTVDSTETVTLECQADYVQNVGGLSQIKVKAGKAGAGDASLEAKNLISMSQDGKAVVELTGGAAMHKTDSTFNVEATGAIDLSTAASMSASASSSMTLSQGGGSVTLASSKVNIEATEVVIKIGDNHVTVDGSGVTVKGAKVDVTADGAVAVSGAMIKLN